MLNYALPSDTVPARFYLLPKVHKTGVPGRPVVWACSSPTEGLSEIGDHFLQPLISSIPSYIKDTNHFLQKLHSLGPLPPDAILVTIDVVALYPSIPHSDGLSALREFLELHNFPVSTSRALVDMAELVLTKNLFEFNKDFYLQLAGTAIGTKMAPAYANIFMSVLEQQLLATSPLTPDVWLRFIDDIFMVWTHGRETLDAFMAHLNAAHPSIKFTSDSSTETVNFLDVQVLKDPLGHIHTDLYTKPTDTHQYLLQSSAHPNHVKRSIAYSQALRILRICSDPDTADTRCSELAEFLTQRGHGRRVVREQITRAKAKFRDPVTVTEPSEPTDRFFTVQYHQALPDIKGILTRYLPVLHTSERMTQVALCAPVLSFSQPPNLGKMLCRAKLREESNTAVQPCQPCGSKRCKLCTALCTQPSVRSHSNNKQFKCRNDHLDCNAEWVIYCISCKQCGIQYVGQTNNLRLRMNGHRSDFSKFGTGSSNKPESAALYKHLKEHGQSDFSVQIIDKLAYSRSSQVPKLSKALDELEKQWIWKLETYVPRGLNIDDGFYCQNKGPRKARVQLAAN